MPGRRLRILVNPVAARAGTLRGLRARSGDAVEWLDCPSAAFLQEQVRAAQHSDLDVLGIAGGDATMALALDALDALNSVPFGIIPAGAVNDFARHLGIPRAPGEALQLLSQGQPHRVDVARATWPGRPERRRFACAATVADRAGVCAWWRLRPRPLRVTWRDGAFEGDVLFVAVSNSRAYGGYPLSPRARFNDGLLDLCLIARMGPLRRLALLPCLLRGTHGDSPQVIQAQSPWVRVEGLGAQWPVALDREAPLAATPAELHCEPAAVQVLLPQLQAESGADSLPTALPVFQAGI